MTSAFAVTSPPASTALGALDAQAMLDSLLSASIVIDEADCVVALNAAARELIETHPTAVLGCPVDAAYRAFLERARRMGGSGESTSFVHSSGGAWYLVQVFPLPKATARTRLTMLSATDIMATKNAEFKVRESEASLEEEATRIAQLGTFRLLWDTGMMQSPHVYTMQGLSPDRFSYSPERYREFVHPDDRADHERLRQDLSSGKSVRGAEFRIIRTDGVIRWLRIDGRVLFDAYGEPYASFGTCQDITEAKQREHELRSLLRRNAILYEALDASPIGVISGGAPNAPLTYTAPLAATFGANAVVYKPFEKSELMKAVNSVLSPD